MSLKVNCCHSDSSSNINNFLWNRLKIDKLCLLSLIQMISFMVSVLQLSSGVDTFFKLQRMTETWLLFSFFFFVFTQTLPLFADTLVLILLFFVSLILLYYYYYNSNNYYYFLFSFFLPHLNSFPSLS